MENLSAAHPFWAKAASFIKHHAMVLIAWAAAAVSAVFVPPDAQYAGYFDLSTLACLFLTLLVVGAFTGIHTFEIASRSIVLKLKNLRRLFVAVVFITYVGSMILANDMALITFLPLGWLSLKNAGKEKHAAYLFIMQNIAANLGGMLTPFGNPQNLYLYSHFSIPTGEFFAVMAPPFAIALLLILGCCLVVGREPLVLIPSEGYRFNTPRTVAYSVLFVVSVLAVFRLFPWYFALAGVGIAVLILDRKAYLKVSYSLLLTFTAFFIFSGNMARIDAVSGFLGRLTASNTLLTGVASCQVISNVPTAVLLSRFVTDYKPLLVAVNIGGLGTPVASLASLITLGRYRAVMPGHTLRYLAAFLAVNFTFLAVLFVAEMFIL